MSPPDLDPLDPFPDHVRQAFKDFITLPGYQNRERLGHDKFVLYQVFLDDKGHKPATAKESKARYEAWLNFELDEEDRRLYRKPVPPRHTERRRVVTGGDCLEVYIETHLRLGHAGRDAMFHDLDRRIYGISRAECLWVKQNCCICVLNQANASKALLQPIISNETFERVQIDLIDMRYQPSHEYCWILHIKDHFSKYTQLYALPSKHAEGVAFWVAIFIGSFFPMKILQCDNGKEFKGITL